MSREGPPVSKPEVDYIRETFCSDLSKLHARMSRRAEAAGLPPISIDVDQARLLQVLLVAIRARRVLDLGTLFGFSAAAMAQALPPSGRVVSVEYEARHAQVARANLKALKLAGKVEVVEGAAMDVMEGLEADSFDLVHIDVDKVNYPKYLEEAVRLVRSGGIVAADNTLAFGKVTQPLATGDPDAPSVKAIQRFNRKLAALRGVTAVLVPMGDGLALGVIDKPKPRR